LFCSFSCVSYPRHLRSFPTRRSSDLHVADVPLACRLIVKLSLIIQSEHGLPHHAFADAHCAVRAVVVVDGRALSGTPAENESFQDRKSTRLNSSHRTISYAVFCLKKK